MGGGGTAAARDDNDRRSWPLDTGASRPMPRPQREIPWPDQRNGWWYVFWYDPTSRRTERLSLGTREADEAQDRYVAFLSEGRSVLRRPATAGLTVREAIESYLREHVGVDPDTGKALPDVHGIAAKERQWIAGRHLIGVLEDTPLSSVDVQTSRWYALCRSRAKRPASPPTIRRELSVLVAAANHAVWMKRLSKDQMPTVDLPPHAPPKECAFLTKEELRTVLAEARKDPDPRVAAFTVLAYATGSRRKRIERLQKSQIDLVAKRIALTPPGRALTKKRAPTVPITPVMEAEIRALLAWSGGSDYLFRDPGYDVYHKFAAVCARAGVADRGNPHVLRHSRATHMLQDGSKMWDVANLLGDTVATVERVYGHHCPDYMAGSAGFLAMSDVLG